MISSYSKLVYHLIFEILFSDTFRRKTRSITNGHSTPTEKLYYTLVLFLEIQLGFFGNHIE